MDDFASFHRSHLLTLVIFSGYPQVRPNPLLKFFKVLRSYRVKSTPQNKDRLFNSLLKVPVLYGNAILTLLQAAKRYHHGRCSDELKSIIPPKACFARSTRFADSQHYLAVKLEKCRTTSFANTFVPMTSRNWNSLPASIFPSTYNLQTFKTRGHKHLRLHPLTWSTSPSLQ